MVNRARGTRKEGQRLRSATAQSNIGSFWWYWDRKWAQIIQILKLIQSIASKRKSACNSWLKWQHSNKADSTFCYKIPTASIFYRLSTSTDCQPAKSVKGGGHKNKSKPSGKGMARQLGKLKMCQNTAFEKERTFSSYLQWWIYI